MNKEKKEVVEETERLTQARLEIKTTPGTQIPIVWWLVPLPSLLKASPNARRLLQKKKKKTQSL
jgi:hypothetical protein